MLHGKIQDPTALPRLGGQPAFRRSIFAEAKVLMQRAALNAAVAARHSDLGRAADSRSGASALEPAAVSSGPCRMTRGRPCNSSPRTTLRYSANALRAEGDVESPGLSTRTGWKSEGRRETVQLSGWQGQPLGTAAGLPCARRLPESGDWKRCHGSESDGTITGPYRKRASPRLRRPHVLSCRLDLHHVCLTLRSIARLREEVTLFRERNSTESALFHRVMENFQGGAPVCRERCMCNAN